MQTAVCQNGSILILYDLAWAKRAGRVAEQICRARRPVRDSTATIRDDERCPIKVGTDASGHFIAHPRNVPDLPSRSTELEHALSDVRAFGNYA